MNLLSELENLLARRFGWTYVGVGEVLDTIWPRIQAALSEQQGGHYNDRATEVWREGYYKLAEERNSLRTQLTELEAENAKLIAWQKAAAEERIVLRERLNEIELGFRHWRDSDWVDSDILRASLTEQQEPAAIDPPEIVVLVDGVALSTPQKEKLRHLILAALTESQEEPATLTEQQER